jgi:transcriptional regulator with XRE-family HTH domain
MTKAAQTPLPHIEIERRIRLGEFFRSHRVSAGLSAETIAQDLELESVSVLSAYESGRISMPLEDVFALTNLLNVAPETVMDLVHSLYMLGAD